MTIMSIFERAYPILRVVWTHRWLSVAAAWLVCIAGWTVVALLPTIYESSARVYVNADPVLTPLLKGLAAETDPTRQVDYMRRTLLSRPNLEEAARLADLDLGDARQRERLLDHLAQTIEIDPVTPNLLAISYQATGPTVAKNVVQSLLTIFADKTTGTSRNDMDSAERFLDSEIADYQAKLRDIDVKRAALNGQYPDLLPIDQNGSRLDRVRSQQTQLEFELSDQTERGQALRKQLLAVPATLSLDQAPQIIVDASGGPDSITRQLQDARKRLDELQAQYTDQYPDVIATRREVARLEAEAKNPAPHSVPGGKTQIANPVYDQLQVKLVDVETAIASIQHKLDVTRAERARVEAAVKAAPGVLIKARDLDRDYALLKTAYDGLVQRREAAKIADAANTKTDEIQFRIVDPPEVPILPVGPNRLLYNTGVLLLGLGAAIAVSLAMLQFDRSIATVGQLRGYGVPVIGTVSQLVDQAAHRTTARQLAGVCASTFLLLLVYGALMAIGARVHLASLLSYWV
jgi:polysaccharide chain length determinant protein (PEP-CTERM system associated)